MIINQTGFGGSSTSESGNVLEIGHTYNIMNGTWVQGVVKVVILNSGQKFTNTFWACSIYAIEINCSDAGFAICYSASSTSVSKIVSQLSGYGLSVSGSTIVNNTGKDLALIITYNTDYQD